VEDEETGSGKVGTGGGRVMEGEEEEEKRRLKEERGREIE